MTGPAEDLAALVRAAAQSVDIRLAPLAEIAPDFTDVVILASSPDMVREGLESLPAGARVYLLSSQVGSPENLPKSGLTITLVVEFPGLMDLSIASGVHPLGAHAALCGAAFVEALITAGRQVSRAALVAAFDDANLLGYGLDYERHPLSGTAEIGFVDLTAR